MSDQNPYSPPSFHPPPTPTEPLAELDPIGLSPKDRQKIEDLISEAKKYYLGIFTCIFCIPFGTLFFPAWYLFLLVKWNSFAAKYPALLEEGLPTDSIQTRFKSSRWKLILGSTVGSLAFVLLFAHFARL